MEEWLAVMLTQWPNHYLQDNQVGNVGNTTQRNATNVVTHTHTYYSYKLHYAIRYTTLHTTTTANAHTHARTHTHTHALCYNIIARTRTCHVTSHHITHSLTSLLTTTVLFYTPTTSFLRACKDLADSTWKEVAEISREPPCSTALGTKKTCLASSLARAEKRASVEDVTSRATLKKDLRRLSLGRCCTLNSLSAYVLALTTEWMEHPDLAKSLHGM